MIDLFDNLDVDMNEGGARVVPIITEIHNVDDGTDIQGNKADDIPILPLRNMVLFPAMTMPVSVGREKSMRLIKEAESSHGSIAVFCQYDSHIEDPVEQDLYRFGTIAAIVYPMDNITDFLYLIGSVFAPMIAVQIADYFILKKEPVREAVSIRNLAIWLAGFLIYRFLMGVDTPVGNTLPDMAVTVILCLIVNAVTG